MQDQATTRTDLTTMPPAERAALALGSSKTETTLRELAQQSAAITTVIDVAGREEAHRAGMGLKNARTAITKTGKAARDDANAFCSAVIAEEKRLIGIVEPEERRVLGLRDGFDAKVAAEKAERDRIEAERVAGIKSKIDLIRQLPTASVNDGAAALRATLDDLLTIVPDAAEYSEFTEAATQAVAEVMEALFQLWSAASAREAEAERLAAERAELVRLQAEQDERERAAKQAQDKLDAERAAFDAERAAFKKQQQEKVAKAEQEREQALLHPATIEQPATALADVAVAVLPEPLATMLAEPPSGPDTDIVGRVINREAEANDNATLVNLRVANWPLPSFDARDWAKAFMESFGDRRDEIDEGLMITWFANALMRGYDEHARLQEVA